MYYEKYAELRDARGMSDYAVGKQCGISPATFTDWKKGKYTPKFDKLSRIAELFGVPMQTFSAIESDEPYYIDDGARKVAEELRTNKELRLLFEAGRDASAEDLKTVHQMLLALKRKERNDA